MSVELGIICPLCLNIVTTQEFFNEYCEWVEADTYGFGFTVHIEREWPCECDDRLDIY